MTPGHIFKAAANFEFAANLLNADFGRRFAAITKQLQEGYQATADNLPTMEPHLVNSAFALELYFKSLIMLETGVAQKGHELLKLCQAISNAKRIRIKELFDEIVTSSPHWVDMKSRFPSDQNSFEFPGVLITANNAFAEWRYAFEGIKTANQLLLFRPALPATRKAILEMKPEWEALVDPTLREKKSEMS